MGYSDNQKAYRIYLPKQRCVLNTIHVEFDTSTMMGGQFQDEGEEQFHYSSLKSNIDSSEVKVEISKPTSKPVIPDIILDEPKPSTQSAAPQNPPMAPLTPKGPTHQLPTSISDSVDTSTCNSITSGQYPTLLWCI